MCLVERLPWLSPPSSQALSPFYPLPLASVPSLARAHGPECRFLATRHSRPTTIIPGIKSAEAFGLRACRSESDTPNPQSLGSGLPLPYPSPPPCLGELFAYKNGSGPQKLQTWRVVFRLIRSSLFWSILHGLSIQKSITIQSTIDHTCKSGVVLLL